jgi:hypothetical protein
MQKWEYFVMPLGPNLGAKEAREFLNKQGDEGWEFIDTLPGKAGGAEMPLIVFKRPKP